MSPPITPLPVIIQGRPIEGDPWTRQPGETAQAFSCFAAFRDMGPQRSTTSVAKQMGRGVSIIKTWSLNWRWTARALAWDDELDRQARAAQVEAVKDMNDFHARVGRQMINVVARRLVGDEAHGVKPLDVERLKPADLARLADIGARLERVARGEPDSITEQQHHIGEALGHLSRRVLDDPDAMHAALRLLEDIETDQSA